jgi:osmotically-inducible protein OsmY
MVGIVSRSDLLCYIENAPLEEPVRGDGAIRRSVQARLRERADLLTALPDVSVSEGVVHLSGKVHSQLERDAVRVVVEGIRGVAGVEDHLEILL